MRKYVFLSLSAALVLGAVSVCPAMPDLPRDPPNIKLAYMAGKIERSLEATNRHINLLNEDLEIKERICRPLDFLNEEHPRHFLVGARRLGFAQLHVPVPFGAAAQAEQHQPVQIQDVQPLGVVAVPNEDDAGLPNNLKRLKISNNDNPRD